MLNPPPKRPSAIGHEHLEWAICDENTLERAWGWVFFYDTRRFFETGDDMARLAGNAPLIVNKETGAVTVTGTAHPIEHYLAVYERALAPS